MISADGLKSGDKIPSERELSERLNVGRSSVREALRALELLGLIETRRGEGTFIRDFRENQLVQLLGTFVLEDIKAKQDVVETKNLIEMDSLRLILARIDEKMIIKLRNVAEVNFSDVDQFFQQMIELADNHLLSRIWLILKDYHYSLQLKKDAVEPSTLRKLVAALIESNEEKTMMAYRQLRNLSNFTDK
jgi:GntR family transcriptional regulator, transcriptional repressor for pyruvate dehydrogenase complex